MYCSKCGTQLPEDSDFCTNCGSKILKETTVVQPKTQTKMTGRKKTVAIIAVCLVAVLGVWVLINEIGKANLKKELMRDWETVEVDGGSYYSLELDFSDDEIEYNFESFYIDDTIATYKYTVISGNQFKVDGRDTVYTVEFNDDKTMMTITPALTSTDASEYWFHFDD